MLELASASLTVMRYSRINGWIKSFHIPRVDVFDRVFRSINGENICRERERECTITSPLDLLNLLARYFTIFRENTSLQNFAGTLIPELVLVRERKSGSVATAAGAAAAGEW